MQQRPFVFFGKNIYSHEKISNQPGERWITSNTVISNSKKGNFEKSCLCVGNLVPPFQHILTVVIRPTGWGGDDVRGCYDPVSVVPNCWELV